jgi:hypothetical protein
MITVIVPDGPEDKNYSVGTFFVKKPLKSNRGDVDMLCDWIDEGWKWLGL